jgi:hypothetical protein
MKTKLLTTLAAAVLATFSAMPAAEARGYHRGAPANHVYISGYRSCGTPIYTERYFIGYGACGRIVWGYRSVRVAPPVRYAPPRVVAPYPRHGYHPPVCAPAPPVRRTGISIHHTWHR